MKTLSCGILVLNAQHELLLTRGCELFQGYLFGRPVPIEDWKAG